MTEEIPDDWSDYDLVPFEAARQDILDDLAEYEEYLRGLGMWDCDEVIPFEEPEDAA